MLNKMVPVKENVFKNSCNVRFELEILYLNKS